MPVIKLPKDEAKQVIWDDHKTAKLLSTTIVDTSRWSIIKEAIVSIDGKFYSVIYSVGATEQQYEGPFEYEEEVEFTQVEPYEKTVTEYRPVKD